MDTTKDTTMQHVTDAVIAEIKRIAEHPLKAPVIVRANVMLGVIMCLEEAEKECDELRVEFIAGLLERIEQLESGPATAEQDSRQKQARIEILEVAEKKRAERDELLAALQRIADGQEMSGVFTFADVVLRYQEIARTAIARATGGQP